ncbi:mpv17-like protein [Drosophila navojoa]|uniref:mpv17-like protein n=1 Tax=Drosophila navojoa TaxID=7232 RepID=UPI000847B091|nr:mpv17-like protein [Drosophila navojoa]
MSRFGYLREGVNVALLMGAGDMIAQFFIEKKEFSAWNISRTARFSAVGLIVVGPALRKWYSTLDRLVSKEQTPIKRGFKKMLLDQCLFAPPFTLLLSYLVPFVNGEKHEDIVQHVRQNYFTIMKNSFLLWPLAQTINFIVVPSQYQVIYVQIVALIWNCYLSDALNS